MTVAARKFISHDSLVNRCCSCRRSGDLVWACLTSRQHNDTALVTHEAILEPATDGKFTLEAVSQRQRARHSSVSADIGEIDQRAGILLPVCDESVPADGNPMLLVSARGRSAISGNEDPEIHLQATRQKPLHRVILRQIDDAAVADFRS